MHLPPEIICMICDHVYDSPATLSLLARTSKKFQYALDLLWNEQHGLLPLLKCMPGDLWETEEQQSLKFMGLRRQVLPSDLDRLLFYSRRVKLFILSQDLDVGAEDLRACLAGEILFPNIMAVVFGYPDSFEDLTLFLGPKIKHLGLALNDTPLHLGLLSTLTLRYPVLKSVDINLPLSASTTRGVSDAICSLRAVTRLTVNTLTTPALLHLSGLPNLRVFNVLSVGDVRVPDALPDARFADLEHLSVGATSISQCAGLVQFFSAAPLSTAFFALNGSERSPASAWTAFAAAMHDHCVHSALRTVFVYHGSPPDDPPVPSAPPSGASLRPLLAFTHLVSLILEPFDGFDLDEAVLHDMAHAWPSIGKLVLGVSGPEQDENRARIPLRAVLPFALHCPKLQTLGVVFDATVPLAAEVGAPKGGHRVLRRLLVGPSAITEEGVADVARFLAGVFPDLDNVVCAEWHGQAEVWGRVGKEIAQFSAARGESGIESLVHSDLA
ncbi:hypothetical protein DFH09DRAFT_447427 [Mycena vulgaris]|nr:hypothetical protein DFH09DRAFT_447427 [Mycena vulgaris]